MENNDKKDNVGKAEATDSSRRKFLRNSGIAVGGVAGGAILGGLFGNPFKTEEEAVTTTTAPPPQTANYSEAMQFFTRKEDFDTMAAAAEVIFPEDENGPGAIGLRAHYYVDKQLASPWGKNVDDYMKRPFRQGESPLTRGDMMLTGLRKMNEVSQADHQDIFVSLEKENQIAILQKFEAGEVELNLASSAVFFGLLRQLTLEGCYADPLYGGNKDMQGWKMKEFPGAYMSYTDVVESKEFVYKEPKSLSDHM